MRAGARRQGDARQSERVAHELGSGAERNGAAGLPKYVAIGAAVDDYDFRITCGSQRASDLENEIGVGITLSVKRQRSRQLSRGSKAVDTCSQGESTQIRARKAGVAGLSREGVVGSREIALGSLGKGVI